MENQCPPDLDPETLDELHRTTSAFSASRLSRLCCCWSYPAWSTEPKWTRRAPAGLTLVELSNNISRVKADGSPQLDKLDNVNATLPRF
jgi:hypothetical protein